MSNGFKFPKQPPKKLTAYERRWGHDAVSMADFKVPAPTTVNSGEGQCKMTQLKDC